MQKYFISKENLKKGIIDNNDAFHITTVMRGAVGDKILVSDEEKTYLCSLTSLSNNVCMFDIVEEIELSNELSCTVTIFQGYPKGDKLEDVIKHGTELGAYEFVPTIMKRSLFKLDEKKKITKIERFQKIAKEAAEQSNRTIVPKIKDILNLKEIDF